MHISHDFRTEMRRGASVASFRSHLASPWQRSDAIYRAQLVIHLDSDAKTARFATAGSYHYIYSPRTLAKINIQTSFTVKLNSK